MFLILCYYLATCAFIHFSVLNSSPVYRNAHLPEKKNVCYEYLQKEHQVLFDLLSAAHGEAFKRQSLLSCT